MSGPVEKNIRDRLNAEFAPLYLEVDNESSQHSVPKGSETHFRVLIVSARFDGLSRIDRQRLVNAAVGDLIQPGAVHAFTQRALTPSEHAASKTEFVSPDCAHGAKK